MTTHAATWGCYWAIGSCIAAAFTGAMKAAAYPECNAHAAHPPVECMQLAAQHGEGTLIDDDGERGRPREPSANEYAAPRGYDEKPPPQRSGTFLSRISTTDSLSSASAEKNFVQQMVFVKIDDLVRYSRLLAEVRDWDREDTLRRLTGFIDFFSSVIPLGHVFAVAHEPWVIKALQAANGMPSDVSIRPNTPMYLPNHSFKLLLLPACNEDEEDEEFKTACNEDKEDEEFKQTKGDGETSSPCQKNLPRLGSAYTAFIEKVLEKHPYVGIVEVWLDSDVVDYVRKAAEKNQRSYDVHVMPLELPKITDRHFTLDSVLDLSSGIRHIMRKGHKESLFQGRLTKKLKLPKNKRLGVLGSVREYLMHPQLTL